MSNENTNNSSSLPLVIIGLVLIAAIGGGWWLYSNQKKQPDITNNNKANVNGTTDDGGLQLYKESLTKVPGASPANSLGSPNATVTVEEFADYQCPTCATVHPQVKEINSIYGGRIRFIYRSFPLTQIHKNAYDAALAAEAAGQQGKFWAMQDQLFTNQQAWSNSNDARKMFEEYAQKIGVDLPKYQNDLVGLPLKTRVDADMARGQFLRLTGTPSIFVNGKQLTIEQMNTGRMRQIIEAELQKAGGATQSNPPANQPANSTSNAATNSK